MSTESKIIAAIMQDRAAFVTVQSYYDKGDLSDLGDLIYQEVALYYKRDGKVGQCDKSCILERLERKYERHADKFKRVISRIRAVSIDNVLEDYRQVKRKSAAEVAGSYLMKGDYEAAAPLLEKLASLEDMTKGNDSAPVVYQDAEADDFCESLELKNRIPIAPKKLNDHLGGGLIAGCHVLVYAPPECFIKYTQVLTSEGWLHIQDVKESSLVAAVNTDRSVTFEHPTNIVARRSGGDLYRIYNRKGQLDLIVTPNHDMLTEKRGILSKNKACDVIYYQGIKTHTAALAGGTEAYTPEVTLGIAIQADARARVYHTHGYSKHKYTYELTLKKQRKIDRLREALVSSNTAYTETTNGRGNTCFYIKSNTLYDKDFAWVDVSSISLSYAKAFAEELQYWDGSTQCSTRWKYSNCNKVAVDKAQAVVALAGYNSKLGNTPDKRGYDTCYELTIRSNYTPVDGSSVHKEIVPMPDATVYCMAVSTGMLLVRRKGAVSIQGNCGKTAMAINIAYSIAVSGRVCMYFGNEESAEMYLNRMLCRFCRWPLAKVLRDKKAAMVLARTRGWKNLIFVYCSPGSIGQIQELILKKKPDVVIIDQLSNVTLGKGKEPEKTQLLEKLAYVMRIFYARNKIAGISMSQADEKAIGKLYLTIKNVYYSNIGVQGMCDVMIGMGMNDEYERMGRRVLNITKNKLGGTHDAIHVQLMNEISMLKGI